MPAAQERHESLSIAKRLNKMISLPNSLNWKVHGSDVLHRGRVLCFLRSKRTFLPDDVSPLRMRTATVTKNGFLVLYETLDQGLIIDLRAASHVLSECDKYKSKKTKYSRSHVKIRLPHGNVHLFVRGTEIPKWTGAILEAHVAAKPSTLQKKTEVKVETAIEEVVEMKTSPLSLPDTMSSGMITVLERNDTPSEDSVIPSVRRGAVPVDTLRRKLEPAVAKPKELAEPEKQQFVSSLFVFHDGRPQRNVFSEERKVILKADDCEPEKAKMEWWMRSLRC